MPNRGDDFAFTPNDRDALMAALRGSGKSARSPDQCEATLDDLRAEVLLFRELVNVRPNRGDRIPPDVLLFRRPLTNPYAAAINGMESLSYAARLKVATGKWKDSDAAAVERSLELLEAASREAEKLVDLESRRRAERQSRRNAPAGRVR